MTSDFVLVLCWVSSYPDNPDRQVLLTLNFVQIRMNSIQYLPKMNLSRVKEHHHGTRRADLIRKTQRKPTLRKGNTPFQTGNPTSREVQFGQNITNFLVFLSLLEGMGG